MQVIKKGHRNVAKIWYYSKTLKVNSRYRVAMFVIERKIEAGILLCNTVTGEMVLLSRAEEKCYTNLPSLYQDPLLELILHKYVVPVDYNEIAELENLKKILRYNIKFTTFYNYNILTTTSCNAHCFYCYQSDIKHVHMSKKTAVNLIDFIEKHSDHHTVNISWFGGEPLVGIKRIDQICDGLNQKQVKFTSEMTSNCFLFDRDIIARAQSVWHLRRIQVTLDGTENIYNQTKAYARTDINPYHRVMNNIVLLVEAGINVSIRLNLDTHNATDLSTLIKELGKLFRGRNNLSVYVSLLKENVGFSPVNHSDDEFELILRQGFELEREIQKNGLKRKSIQALPHLKLSNCMANNPYTIQCAPNGLIGKCEDQIFTHVIGTLDDVFNVSEMKWWEEEEIISECEECAFLPYCPHLKNCPLNKHRCESLNRNHMYDVYRNLMKDIFITYSETNSAKQFMEV